jgi:hypothetical protein
MSNSALDYFRLDDQIRIVYNIDRLNRQSIRLDSVRKDYVVEYVNEGE